MLKNYFLLNLLLVLIITILGVTLYKVLTMPVDIPTKAAVVSPRKIVKKPARTIARIDSSSYDVIAFKNLFHPSRSTTDKMAKVPAKPVSPRDTPQLFGTIITGDKKIAILENPSTKKSGTYNVNDSVAGFVVSEILEEKVILKSGAEIVEVKLRSDKKFKAAKRMRRPKTLRKSPQRRKARRVSRRERRR